MVTASYVQNFSLLLAFYFSFRSIGLSWFDGGNCKSCHELYRRILIRVSSLFISQDKRKVIEDDMNLVLHAFADRYLFLLFEVTKEYCTIFSHILILSPLRFDFIYFHGIKQTLYEFMLVYWYPGLGSNYYLKNKMTEKHWFFVMCLGGEFHSLQCEKQQDGKCLVKSMLIYCHFKQRCEKNQVISKKEKKPVEWK